MKRRLCKYERELAVEFGILISALIRETPLDEGPLRARMRELFRAAGVRHCRVCGCTEQTACTDGMGDPCAWLKQDLCTACSPIPALPAKPLRDLKPRRRRGAR